MCSTLQQLYLEEYQSSLSDIIAKTEEELSKSKPMLVTALQVVSALGIQDLKDVAVLGPGGMFSKSFWTWCECVYLKVMPTWAESKKWLKDPQLVGRLIQLPLEDGALSLKEVKKAE
eukprot:CAMPEP_0115020460 /NCGR_PEP_ID=MMETSP0216-20121206/30156_1 /TAXON_ID=223996 /ORGANISM="Protocruzia adherens, Strain Boccale" /LENGTH=116 /DNA_ID=CAMNT_0002392333 /DNA_START=159 /DNA_END=510 /DNA_ORIENTATION=+